MVYPKQKYNFHTSTTLMANVINCDCLKLLVNRVFQIYGEMYFASQLLGVKEKILNATSHCLSNAESFYYFGDINDKSIKLGAQTT